MGKLSYQSKAHSGRTSLAICAPFNTEGDYVLVRGEDCHRSQQTVAKAYNFTDDYLPRCPEGVERTWAIPASVLGRGLTVGLWN